MDVSDIFFFSVPGRGEGRGVRGGGRGRRFFIKNRGRTGGVSEEEAREGKSAGGMSVGRGGLNIFYRGRNAHQEMGLEAKQNKILPTFDLLP